MTYKHGVYVLEQATSILPPVRVESGLPVVFGTAPVHLVDNGPVNEPILCYSYSEAVMGLGYSSDFAKYTLCEFMSAAFALFGVAPVVFVNVFDPDTHKTAIDEETVTLVSGKAKLANGDIVDIPVVKNSVGDKTFVLDTDFTLDRATGDIERIETGSMAAAEELKVAYDKANPGAVTGTDIIGGVDGSTGAYTGLEHLNSIFPKFRLVPGQVVAPGWSHDSGVAAVMHAKAGNINGHFKAVAVVDIDSDTVTKYTDVAATKNTNNLTDEQLIVCWPKVSLGDVEYWLSSQVAALNCLVDSDNGDIPYTSPSNKNLQMDKAIANGVAIELGPDQAGYLNGQGIVTALNFIGGWKCWGNRTGCYPGVTDVKDAFIPIRRMFNWTANTIILTYWQKVDFPVNRRLIETIMDSVNIWLNGLAGRQFILGGRVELLEDENPTTDLMDGVIKFHVYLTPPSPARELDFILEYDPAYLQTLFG